MHQHVAAFVGRCEIFDRVKTNVNNLSPQLQPLLIMGWGNRWPLNFARSLVVTPCEANYIWVMVGYFSNWIELVALPQHFAKFSVPIFLKCVLAPLGAPVKVLTNQGRKFLGIFKGLCTKALIDHCTPLQFQSKADGLAERDVQAIKRLLMKYGSLWGATEIGTLC